MYGRKKKILIIVIILLLITAIGGIAFYLLSNKEERLKIEYIGGDKYVDEKLTAEDFKVIDLQTNKLIDSKKINVNADPLNIDGTVATITYNLSGKDYTGQIVVYPTLVVTSIKAELVADNKHIGSKIKKEDFKVIGTNNKNQEAELTDFSLSHTVLKKAENDVKIEYTTSAGTVSTTLHISVSENFVKGVEAKYIGSSVFIGEDVNEDDFEVYAIWDDDVKTKVEDYNIDDTTLTSATTVLTISITDNLGKTFYTDIKIKAINYVTDIDHVSYVGQEQTVGNTVKKSDFEVYGIYYDGSVSKVENFKITGESVLKSEENTITVAVNNELGDTLDYDVIVKAEQNIIYVGDSRIKELEAYSKSEDAERANDHTDKCYYIYSDKADLKWFNETAKAQIQDILNKNPYTTFRIVISLGSFDFDNVSNYISTYSKLAKTTWKTQRLYIDSINPVNEEQMEKSKVYSRTNINTTKINEFNKQLNQLISNENVSNLKYINTYGELTNQGFTTKDGFNYTNESYQTFHDSVKKLAL